MHTFFSFVFGCRVNEAEKVLLDKTLVEQGFVWDQNNPDVYIINSCAVTRKAEREVRQHIYQVRKKFPNTTIVVTGCAATNWHTNNITVQGVDMLIENKRKNQLPELLATHLKRTTQKQFEDVIGMTDDKFLSCGRLMVKIQDGCDRFCSYCIVPSLRGKPQSYRIKDIITTVKTYEPYIAECILTAINTECFGKDTGETLINLIDTLVQQTTVPIISFGSIHPWSITDEFLSYYHSMMPTGRLLPFFHIPIQSGSDTILRLMNRGYTTKDIMKKLQRIKTIDPHTFIGTDIIVGFPGEGEKEFQETYAFCTHTPLDKIHVFRFSPRPGTITENLTQKIGEATPEEKRRRSKVLLALNKLY